MGYITKKKEKRIQKDNGRQRASAMAFFLHPFLALHPPSPAHYPKRKLSLYFLFEIICFLHYPRRTRALTLQAYLPLATLSGMEFGLFPTAGISRLKGRTSHRLFVDEHDGWRNVAGLLAIRIVVIYSRLFLKVYSPCYSTENVFKTVCSLSRCFNTYPPIGTYFCSEGLTSNAQTVCQIRCNY